MGSKRKTDVGERLWATAVYKMVAYSWGYAHIVLILQLTAMEKYVTEFEFQTFGRGSQNAESKATHKNAFMHNNFALELASSQPLKLCPL